MPDNPRETLQLTARDHGVTRVELFVDGGAVSRLMVIPFRLRVGRAVVPMDGIGGVETDEPFRNRGYARRVLDAAIAHMRQGDAAISMLYGIPHFYTKLGYATAGPNHEVWLDDLKARPLPGGWSVRPATVDDLPALRGMYDRQTACAVGAAVRAAEDPVSFDMAEACGNDRELRVTVGPDARPAGYLWKGSRFWFQRNMSGQHGKALVFAEAMADSPAAADAVLAEASRWSAEPDALESGPAGRVCLVLPHDHPVAHSAAYRSAGHTRQFADEGESMARVIGLRRLIDAVLPELSVRLAAARVAALPAAITLRTDEGDITLGFTASADEVCVLESTPPNTPTVILPQHALARLTLGAVDPFDLLSRLDPPPDASVVAILETLFPLRQPHMYIPDRF